MPVELLKGHPAGGAWWLMSTPEFFPNMCIDGSQGGPGVGVVDTGVEFDGRRVYLPVRLVKQAANELFGMVEGALLNASGEHVAQLQARITELETELADAAPILAAIGRASSRFGGELVEDQPVRPTERKPRRKRTP